MIIPQKNNNFLYADVAEPIIIKYMIQNWRKVHKAFFLVVSGM